MLQITADKCGFPIVELPEMRLAVSWLPLTKIQIEHFIADTNAPHLNQDWYDNICKYNGRILPHQMDTGQYEGIFLTGILPEEVQSVAQWMGYGYDLPTAEEWKIIFNHFYESEATADVMTTVTEANGISRRAREIITKLDAFTNQNCDQLLGDTRRICDQMLMRLGVMEYVYESNYRNSFSGQGQPNRHFHPHTRTLPRDRAEILADHIRKTGGRIKQYGCRLIRRD